MKIVGGRGIGTDKEKMRVVEIEDGDVPGKQFQVHSEGNDLWVTYYEDGPSGRMTVMLDDPVEKTEPSAPFWVRPEREPLAFAPGDTVEDLRHYKVAPEPLSDEARAIITGKELPRAETWELLAQDLIRDARAGMVDIVAESCLQGMVIRGWQGKAWGRLHVSLAKAMKEVCYVGRVGKDEASEC